MTPSTGRRDSRSGDALRSWGTRRDSTGAGALRKTTAGGRAGTLTLRSPCSRGANGDARVVENQAVRVVRQLALEPEPWGSVAVAVPVLGVVEANVALFQPLDVEAGSADVHRRRVRGPADLESETMDRNRIGERRRLEVHVETPVELGDRFAVDPPAAGAIALDAKLAGAAGRPAHDASAASRPAGRESDGVPHRPCLTVLDGGGCALDAEVVTVRVQEHHLEPRAGVAVVPGSRRGRSSEGHADAVWATAPAFRRRLAQPVRTALRERFAVV